MKKIILFIIILGMGMALGVYLQKQPKTQTIENQVHADAEQAGTDVKAGIRNVEAVAGEVKDAVHRAGDVATNVAAQVKTGAQKVGATVTNVVGEIK